MFEGLEMAGQRHWSSSAAIVKGCPTPARGIVKVVRHLPVGSLRLSDTCPWEGHGCSRVRCEGRCWTSLEGGNRGAHRVVVETIGKIPTLASDRQAEHQPDWAAPACIAQHREEVPQEQYWPPWFVAQSARPLKSSAIVTSRNTDSYSSLSIRLISGLLLRGSLHPL